MMLQGRFLLIIGIILGLGAIGYGQNEQSPVAKIAQKVQEALAQEVFNPQSEHWEVIQIDDKPSVFVGASSGYRIVLKYSQSYITNQEPMIQQQRSPLPETAKKIPIIEVRSSHIDLVLFPDNSTPDSSDDIQWLELEQEYYIKPVDMGKGDGFHWFGNMSPYWQEYIRGKFSLTEGQDRIQILADAMLDNNRYPSSIMRLLLNHKNMVIPYLIKRLDDSEESCHLIFRVFSDIHTNETSELLRNYYGLDKYRKYAAEAIAREYRPALKDLYLDMLKRRWYLDSILQYCVQYNWQESLPDIEKICDKPGTWRVYLNSYLAQMAFQDGPAAKGIKILSPEVYTLSTAERVFFKQPGNESAFFSAVNDLFMDSKDSDSIKDFKKARLADLDKLPREFVRPRVAHLLKILDKEKTGMNYPSGIDVLRMYYNMINNQEEHQQVSSIAQKVQDALAEKNQNSSTHWEVTQVDDKPSVFVGENGGYRVVLNYTRSFTRINKSQAGSVLVNSPGKEVYSYIELVFFPDITEPVSAEKIPWLKLKPEKDIFSVAYRSSISYRDLIDQENPEYYSQPVYIGKGEGFHWFGEMSPFWQLYLRDKFSLTGGENLLQALVDSMLAKKDISINGSIEQILVNYGNEAIPYLLNRVTGSNARRMAIFLIFGQIHTPESTDILRKYYGQKEYQEFAARAMTFEPFRPELRDLYVDMIKRNLDADKALELCVQNNWREALPNIDILYDTPGSWYILRCAYNARKSLSEPGNTPEQISQAKNESAFFNAVGGLLSYGQWKWGEVLDCQEPGFAALDLLPKDFVREQLATLLKKIKDDRNVELVLLRLYYNRICEESQKDPIITIADKVQSVLPEGKGWKLIKTDSDPNGTITAVTQRWQILRVADKPSEYNSEKGGYRIELIYTDSQLVPGEPGSSNNSKITTKRSDIDLVLFPDNTEPVSKRSIPGFYSEPTAYLGKCLGFHWFVKMPYPLQELLRDKFPFNDGEDSIGVLVDSMLENRQDKNQPDSAYQLLLNYGNKSIPHLLKKIDRQDCRLQIFDVFSKINTPESSEVLRKYYGLNEYRTDAMIAITATCRPELKDVYLDMLRKQDRLRIILPYFVQNNWREALPEIEKNCDMPKYWYIYIDSYLTRMAFQDGSNAQEIKNAIINNGLEKAKQTFFNQPGNESVFMAVLDNILANDFFPDAAITDIQRAGVETIKKLPREFVKPRLETLLELLKHESTGSETSPNAMDMLINYYNQLCHADEVSSIAQKVLDTLTQQNLDPQSGHWEVIQVDDMPSVFVGASGGYRVVLKYAVSHPTFEQQQGMAIHDLQPDNTDDSKIVVEYSHIDLVLFPDKIGNISPDKVLWLTLEQNRYATPVYMGKGEGFHWFANISPYWQDYLREKLSLIEGQDKIQILVDSMLTKEVDSWTLYSVQDSLVKYDYETIPYLLKKIEDEKSDRNLIFEILGRIHSSDTTWHLQKYYNLDEFREYAANALSYRPCRPELQHLYLDMLKRNLHINTVMEYCVQNDWSDALQYIETLCDKDGTWQVYLNSYLARMAFQDGPEAQEIKDAIITGGLSKARQVLFNQPGNESEFIEAINKVFVVGKMTTEQYIAIRDDGLKMLDSLPRDFVRSRISSLLIILNKEMPGTENHPSSIDLLKEYYRKIK